MTDRDCCKFPYAPLYALIGFLAGVLVVVLRSRKIVAQRSEPEKGVQVKQTPPGGIPADAIVLPDAMPTGALPSPGDLTIIEGIGKKVEAVLNKAGIHDYEQLARATAAELKDILVAAGNRISNPETWPKQAKMAAAAKWDDLKKYQQSLKAGRKTTG